MKAITTQKHPKIFLYLLSRSLERTGYYGLRALVVLFMIGETMQMSREDALHLYGWFTAGVVITRLVGGLFGDFLLGHKRAFVLGGVLQALGAFALCFSSIGSLYLGMGLIAIGVGLYIPNFLAQFGKQYVQSPDLLDAGFTLQNFAVNCGAFLGSIIMGYVGAKFGWEYGFLLAGILSLVAGFLPLFRKDEILSDEDVKPYEKASKGLFVVVLLVGVFIFWLSYNLVAPRLFSLEFEFAKLFPGIPVTFINSLSMLWILPLSIIAAVIWSYYYTPQWWKLTVGLGSGVVGYALLFWVPTIPGTADMFLYIAGVLFLGIGQLLLAPILYSAIVRYGNPKYLAFLLGLSVLPYRMAIGVSGPFQEMFDYDHTILLSIAAGLSIAFAAVVFFYAKNNGGFDSGKA